MEQRESQHVELPQDARYELRRCGQGNALFDMELCAYKRLFEEDEHMDNCYKVLLTSLLSKEERLIVGRTTMQKFLEEVDESSLYPLMKDVNRDEPHIKQGDRAHSSEEGYVVRENSGKAMEERLRPHKERKSKHLLIEHEDACANAVKAFTERREPNEKRNGKGLLFVNNNVRENSRKASQGRIELHKKREGKEHLIEHEDPRENARKTLGGRSEPHHKRKGLFLVRDCVREKDGKAFGDRTRPHLKRKDKEHLIEDNDPENGVKENDHIDYEPFLKYLKEKPTDEEIETKKFLPSNFRNVFMKNKLKYERVKSNKRLARDTIMEILLGKDGEGEIGKCLTCDCENVVKNHRELIKKSSPAHFRDNVAMIKSRNSEYERMKIKKMSTTEFRNATIRNCRKYATGTEKRLGREFRSVRGSNKNINESGDDDDDDDEDTDDDIDEDTDDDIDEDTDDEDTDDDIDEEEEGEDSDVEIIESASWHKGPFVPSLKFRDMEEDADFRHLGRSNSSKNASDSFRKEALDVLGQPFDIYELKWLREAVRDGSYYNYYPDLERKLKRCRYERGKCLNILRGLFFWLQNVCRDGAFKPWKDSQCLAVEPPFSKSSPPPPSSARMDRA